MPTSRGGEIHNRRLLASLAVLFGVALFAAVGLSGTPESARALTPPPADKAEIFFTNGGRILSMAGDGSDRKVLFGRDRRPENDGLGAIEPAVSPDGEKVTFGFRRDAGYEGLIDVWVMNSDGTGARRILSSTEHHRYGDPDFTPSGRIIAAEFTEQRRRAVARIFTMDPAGGSVRTILKLGQRARPWQSWKNLAEPSLSPDGGKLLYLLDPGYDGVFASTGYGSSLRVRNLDTGKGRELAEHSLGGDFSPDGRRIALSEVDTEGDEDFCSSSGFECSNFSRIRLVNADGSKGRYLTDFRKGAADERRPDWNAAGRIVFQSTRGRKREIADSIEIWSVRPGGECLTRLTNGSPASLSPVLANPDGKLTGPRDCGSKPPGPIREVGPPATTGPGPAFWLGRSFRNVMLSWAEAEDGETDFYYGDCGAIPASGCGREVIIYNVDVCEAGGYATAVIGSGAIQEQRGIPVMRSLKPGRETPPFTMGFSGRTLFFLIGGSRVGDRGQQHRLEIDGLRPVGADRPEGDLPAPRIPAGEIRTMKRVERLYARTGSVRRTARRLGRSEYFVRASLRFGRKYRAAGGYQAVNCPRPDRSGSDSAANGSSLRGLLG